MENVDWTLLTEDLRSVRVLEARACELRREALRVVDALGDGTGFLRVGGGWRGGSDEMLLMSSRGTTGSLFGDVTKGSSAGNIANLLSSTPLSANKGGSGAGLGGEDNGET